MKKMNLLILGLVILSIILGVVVYSYMPDKVASHWNAAGEVDGYMPKFWGVFILPIILVVFYLFYIFIPKIDPLKKNIISFEKEFDLFILALVLFMFYVYFLTLFWNLGYVFDIGRFMVPALGILFIFIGVLLKKAKRNFFIGIRTPWTLSSDSVWDKTHKLGSILFVLLGIISILAAAVPEVGFLLVIIPIVVVVLVLVIYSYVAYKQEGKK
jgi:uncharacterized membrane protein